MSSQPTPTMTIATDPAYLDKLGRLREAGIDPYPYSFDVTGAPDDIQRHFDRLVMNNETVSTASRVMGLRTAGRHLVFLDLAANAEQIRRGHKIQVMVRRDDLDDQSWTVAENLNVGDWVGIQGNCFHTRAGERTIAARSITMLAKSLRPLPVPKIYLTEDGQRSEAFTVQDIDMLWRYPEIDMLTRRKAEVLVSRGRILHAVRGVLGDEYDCVEVETPFMNPHFGGAEAHPFRTTVRALNQEVFLAISPEIELKRVIVGGLGSGGELGRGVYFVARNFRNEGVDRTHNPEFTSVEVYLPYVDYEYMMPLTERLFAAACFAVHGRFTCQYGDHVLDFSKPWPRLEMVSLVSTMSGIDVGTLSFDAIREEIRRRQLHCPYDVEAPANPSPERRRAEMLAVLQRTGVAPFYKNLPDLDDEDLQTLILRHKLHKGVGLDQEWDFLVLDLFDIYCEHALFEPCHVILHPARSTVLCKEYRGGPLPNGGRLIERFESFVMGMEVSNAYSELNDPLIQRRLVEEQAAERQAGNETAMPHNEPFLRAIELGMPPCGGLGIGIDRMVILLTNSQSIREVIAFPLVAAEH